MMFAGFAVLVFAADPEFSGAFDSTVNYAAGAGDMPVNSWGVEEYANLRLRVRPRDNVIFNAAFNFSVLSGSYLEFAEVLGSSNDSFGLASTPVVYGQNYAAAMELERLYFRVNSEYFDNETGLLRMNFGYGQIWGSSDFLNPRNPLFPNARPRGVLATNFSFYPTDSLKLMVFAAAPKDPLGSSGGGFLPGLSLDQHWDRASIQAIYAYETPKSFDEAFLSGTRWGLHRFGFSLKADLELGFVADVLYTFNPAKSSGSDGLSAGTGFDYSFLRGDLYVLFEYLFNGSLSATAWNTGNLLGWKNHNYLYGTGLYRFNNYTSVSLSMVFCFDDLSFQPIVGFGYEVFQGFSLNLTMRVPLDASTLSGGKVGELGPIPPGLDGSPGKAGARVIVEAAAKLRF